MCAAFCGPLPSCGQSIAGRVRARSAPNNTQKRRAAYKYRARVWCLSFQIGRKSFLFCLFNVWECILCDVKHCPPLFIGVVCAGSATYC